jgi:hypothetical protein
LVNITLNNNLGNRVETATSIDDSFNVIDKIKLVKSTKYQKTLLVEDNPVNKKIFALIFDKCNCEIE